MRYGIKKICKAFAEAGLPPPIFDEISNGTRITIERTAAKSIVQGRTVGELNGALPEKIILYIAANPGTNRKALVARLGV